MVNVLKLQQRTARYELADGIRDFQMAFWLLVTGVYAWLTWDHMAAVGEPMARLVREQGSLFALILIFALVVGIPFIVSELTLRCANNTIRRRWLWRETGFVKNKGWVVPRWILFISFAIALTTFVIGTMIAIETEDGWFFIRSLYVGIGLQFAFQYFAMGQRLDIQRYKAVAAAGLVATVGLLPLSLSLGVFCLGISAAWALILVIGGVYAMRETLQLQGEAANAA